MADLAELKKALNARLAVLGERVDETDHELREPMSADFAEQATEAEDDETLDRLGEAARAEIVQIRAALARIDEGGYGECVACGEPISAKRLEALPYATRCIECASAG
jgi:DnaK suppressor protein